MGHGGGTRRWPPSQHAIPELQHQRQGDTNPYATGHGKAWPQSRVLQEKHSCCKDNTGRVCGRGRAGLREDRGCLCVVRMGVGAQGGCLCLPHASLGAAGAHPAALHRAAAAPGRAKEVELVPEGCSGLSEVPAEPPLCGGRSVAGGKGCGQGPCPSCHPAQRS